MARKKRRPPMTSTGKGASCAYCERRLEGTASRSNLAATRDHVYPKSMGGTHRVWSCRLCNSLKGDMTPGQWRRFREENPGWWRKDRPELTGTAVLCAGPPACNLQWKAALAAQDAGCPLCRRVDCYSDGSEREYRAPTN